MSEYKEFYGVYIRDGEPLSEHMPLFFPLKSIRHAADHRKENHIDVIETAALTEANAKIKGLTKLVDHASKAILEANERIQMLKEALEVNHELNGVEGMNSQIYNNTKKLLESLKAESGGE